MFLCIDMTIPESNNHSPSLSEHPYLPWHVLFLGVALACSSLLVVWSTYDTRQLNRRLHVVRQETAQAQLTWRQLRLEYNTHLNHLRTAELARNKLGMYPPHLGDSRLVRLDAQP